MAGDGLRHGASRYNKGCRCLICTEEKTASQRRWRQKKGLGTGKVGTPRKRTQQARGGLPWDWTH
ncbi:hypothetical protein SEA_GARDENSALSA_133 [Mycobacterium phage GardenSalsa]|nr:hypothetical protein SEA_GARDENSALSA_133 [Mycobacterium phage GardenSalsa]